MKDVHIEALVQAAVCLETVKHCRQKRLFKHIIPLFPYSGKRGGIPSGPCLSNFLKMALSISILENG